MATNTYGSPAGGNQLSNEARTLYRLDLIKRLLARLPYFNDFQKKTVGKHTGGFGSGQIQWRHFAALAAATTPLTEGVPPAAQNLSVTTVTANLSQYGNLVKITDILESASIDDVARESQDLLAENAGLTLFSLLVTEMKNNTTTQIANGKAARTDLLTTDVITGTEIKKAVRTLRNNNAKPFPDGTYHALVSPSVSFDLTNDDEWVASATSWGGNSKGGPSVIKYGQEGNLGVFHNVTFKESSLAPAYTSPTSYGVPIFGPDWLAMSDFVGMTVAAINEESQTGGVDVKYIPPSHIDKSDPLGQYGLAGWKAAFVAKVLDNARCVLLHVGASS